MFEQRAVLDNIVSNPEQIYWVLDGYDVFPSNISRQKEPKHIMDPEERLPVSALISGLLNRQLLPGCTVVVTCRERDVSDLDGMSDKVGQLLRWGIHEIKVHVDNFFGAKGKKGI